MIPFRVRHAGLAGVELTRAALVEAWALTVTEQAETTDPARVAYLETILTRLDNHLKELPA